MTAFPFVRLFSMPAFEALRILRQYASSRPGVSPEELATLIARVEADATSYDLEAALFLHARVPDEAPHESVGFYRHCIFTVVLLDAPDWARLVTLGRGKFIRRLKADEFRDIRSLFAAAELMAEPPSLSDVKWWDDLQTHVRLQKDLEFNERSRQAELLSLQHERAEMAKVGLTLEPVWMAIEDNTAGYDVLSYRPGVFGPINRLIEVKSTIANPPSFILSRGEWEKAKSFGQNFVFQIWVFAGGVPKFHEKTVAEVEPHIPADSGKGRWKNAVVPLKIPAVQRT